MKKDLKSKTKSILRCSYSTPCHIAKGLDLILHKYFLGYAHFCLFTTARRGKKLKSPYPMNQ